jgi:hypothetical protein
LSVTTKHVMHLAVAYIPLHTLTASRDAPLHHTDSSFASGHVQMKDDASETGGAIPCVHAVFVLRPLVPRRHAPAGRLGVLAPDAQAPVGTQTTVVPDLGEPDEVVTQAGVDGRGGQLRSGKKQASQVRTETCRQVSMAEEVSCAARTGGRAASRQSGSVMGDVDSDGGMQYERHAGRC